MKFTEEQYRQIVEAWDSGMFYKDRTQAVVDVMCDENMVQSMAKGLALANPATREWARKQFVEKEKRYVWRCEGNSIAKIGGEWCLVDEKRYGRHLFTETEIKNSPFKQEWFEKEEV